MMAPLPGRMLVAGHVSEVYGPVQALRNHLQTRGARFDFVTQPLLPSAVDRSRMEAHEGGRAFMHRDVKAPGGPMPVAYARQARLLERWARERVAENGPYDLMVGIDVLNASVGLRLKRAGLVRRVVFYVIDWTPVRFANPVLNRLYHALDRRTVSKVDVVWNISRRIQEVRARQGVAPERNRVVGVGIELHKIPRIDESEVRRNTVVFVSHLSAGKGIDLLLEAAERLPSVAPDVTLEIIGAGPLEPLVRRRTASLPARSVVFRGPMAHAELLSYLPACGVGLAPYEEDPTNITQYADPTKPKEYLACGLPVIVTRVPWIAEEIERRPMGIAIDYDADQLVNAIVRLTRDDDLYWRCRRNAIAFTRDLSWESIYDAAFAELAAVDEVGS